MPRDIANRAHAPLDWSFKALPATEDEVGLADIASLGWNVLAEDLVLPAAVIRESALTHNLDWMRRFCELAGVEICPHGKTTMSPQLFELQLAQGAWGMTAATVGHVRVYRHFGIERIILAAQLVGKQNILYILDQLARDPKLDFYCLVDSVEGVEILEMAIAAHPARPPVQVLLELGIVGGRAGVRDDEAVIALAERIAGSPYLRLRGIEAFEGIVQGDMSSKELHVRGLVERMAATGEICNAKALFDGPPLLTAGGSAFFDLVTAGLCDAPFSRDFTVILRSGCYLTHDSEHYAMMAARIAERSPAAKSLGEGLRPAIELWAYVHSRPEPTRVIAGIGKRDASHDLQLPRPLGCYRPGKGAKVELLGVDHRTVRLDDQHAYLDVPESSSLQPGDMLCFGISHPCTTFDRWQALYLADDALNVTGAVRTYF